MVTGPQGAVEEKEEIEVDECDGSEVEMDQEEGSNLESKRMSNKKAANADTFCLEPMPSSSIPPHQVEEKY